MHLLFLLPTKQNMGRNTTCSYLSHMKSLTQEDGVGTSARLHAFRASVSEGKSKISVNARVLSVNYSQYVL